MIFIEFKIDENTLAENLEMDITEYQACSFVVSIFIMPVRMQMNGIDLFKSQDDPWAEAPIMNLASNGLLSVKDLKKEKRVSYSVLEGPGDFEFTLIDETQVKVDFFDCNKHTILIVKYEELLSAFQQFANKVRVFLWERVPQMNNHPYWGPWLREERD